MQYHHRLRWEIRKTLVFLSKSNKKSATYKSHETLVVQILPTEVVDTENVVFLIN